MVRAATIALLSSLVLAAPAAADWRFAKWGMRPAELAAAGGTTIVRKDGQTIWLYDLAQPFTSNGVRFGGGSFGFKNNRLTEIEFWSEDPLSVVDQAATAAYGRPDLSDNRGVPIRVFRDAKHRNSIKIKAVGATIFVTYSEPPEGF